MAIWLGESSDRVFPAKDADDKAERWWACPTCNADSSYETVKRQTYVSALRLTKKWLEIKRFTCLGCRHVWEEAMP